MRLLRLGGNKSRSAVHLSIENYKLLLVIIILRVHIGRGTAFEISGVVFLGQHDPGQILRSSRSRAKSSSARFTSKAFYKKMKNCFALRKFLRWIARFLDVSMRADRIVAVCNSSQIVSRTNGCIPYTALKSSIFASRFCFLCRSKTIPASSKPRLRLWSVVYNITGIVLCVDVKR